MRGVRASVRQRALPEGASVTLEEKIEKARAAHAVLLRQRAIVDERCENLSRVAEELSLRESAEAWQDPQPSRDEGFTVWRCFSAFTRSLYGGASLRAGSEGAPARGERGRWALSVGVEKARTNNKDAPQNVDLGDKCWEAWRTWSNEGARLVILEREFEALIREIVTS